MSDLQKRRRLDGFGLTYEDVAVGDWFDTPTAMVSEATIEAFAAMTGDRFQIHMSDEAARQHGFPARVAHGLLVLSLVDGLKNLADARFRAIASLGWTWRFAAPVLVKDSIRAHVVITDKRTTRQASRAILTLRFTVLNQRDIIVQEGENQLMIYRTDRVRDGASDTSS